MTIRVGHRPSSSPASSRRRIVLRPTPCTPSGDVEIIRPVSRRSTVNWPLPPPRPYREQRHTAVAGDSARCNQLRQALLACRDLSQGQIFSNGIRSNGESEADSMLVLVLSAASVARNHVRWWKPPLLFHIIRECVLRFFSPRL